MWDAFAKVLTNDNALLVLIFVSAFIILLIILAKMGIVRINTGKFQLGDGDDYRERAIIQQQTEWAHIYVQGLAGEIDLMCKSIPNYDPYISKYILERMYCEVVEWITYNHINLDSDYISIKQDKIKMLTSSLVVKEEFRSPEFFTKLDKWTEEIIRKLVKIREVYK